LNKDRRFEFDNPARIRELREEHGLTQHRLSVLLDLPQSRISELEHGKRVLKDTEARHLSRFFKIPVIEFRKK